MKKHNANANENIYAFLETPWHGHQWQHLWLRGTARCIHSWPFPLNVVRILSGCLVLSSSAHTHVLSLKFEFSMSSAWSSVRSLQNLPSTSLLPQLLEVCGKHAQLLQREYGLQWRVLPFHRLWAQGPRLLRDLSRALMQLLDSPPLFPNKVSSADPDFVDATLEDTLHQVHRVQADHSVLEDLTGS